MTRALITIVLVAAVAYFGLSGRVDEVAGPPPPDPQSDVGASFETAFERGVQSGWSDWGWCRREIGETAALHLSGKSGWILAKPALQGTFDVLSVRMRLPPGVHPADLVLQVGGASWEGPEVRLDANHLFNADDGFVEARASIDELSPQGAPFERVKLRAKREVADDAVVVDRVRLRRVVLEQRAPTVKQQQVTVDLAAPTTPISPWVYGVAFDPQKPDAPWPSKPTIRRFGGNASSRFNPQIGAWNTASDWFFENHSLGKGFTPQRFVDEGVKRGAQASFSVPMLGWVAKDTTSQSFSTSTAAQRATDPWRKEAGDGYAPDGPPWPAPAPTVTSVPFTPQDAARLVAGTKGVTLWHLDNEPDLWHETHRDVHPEPVGYDELLERSLVTAAAIRDAAPDAVVAGPASWGWTGYFYSAKDVAFGRGFSLVRPDRRRHGDVPLLQWWLREMAAAEKAQGKRLVDALDVHYYPQSQGIYGQGERTDDEAARRRVRSTRSLWDETYQDESWIKEPIALIPRMQRLIADEAPGKKLVIGEYSFGGEEHISGGVAQAEALGRFATSGVYAAFYWTAPKPGSPASWAFRAYRDYDAAGGRFLDDALPAVNDGDLSVFPSYDAATGKAVLVIVNRSFDQHVELDLKAAGRDVTGVRAFRYAAGSTSLQAIEAAADAPLHLPAASFTVVEWTLRR